MTISHVPGRWVEGTALVLGPSLLVAGVLVFFKLVGALVQVVSVIPVSEGGV